MTYGFAELGAEASPDRDGDGYQKRVTDGNQRRTQRQPMMLETSRPGVFAAGDVRSGSVKRVASAVGEGSMAIRQIHEYFGT
jgi:thioredoxin reductase